MKKIVYLLLCVLVFLSFTSCHRDNDEVNIDVSVITDIQEDAITFLNNQSSSGQSFETALNNCIQQLIQNPKVESAFVQDENQIVIKYQSGVTGVIYFIEDDEGLKKLDKKTINTKPSIHFPKEGIEDSLALFTNHKVLIWGAWPFEWEEVKNLFNSCSDISFDVTTISGKNCTMESLYELTKYGFVYINTHGGTINDNLSYIITRDTVNPGSGFSMEDLKDAKILIVTCGKVKNEYINNQEVRICEIEGHWFGVTSTFLSKYVSGTFDGPSIVYISACESFKNNSLQKVFMNEKKASAYLGFTETVYSPFACYIGTNFVRNMIEKKLDAHGAYLDLAGLVDPHPNSQQAELKGEFNKYPTYNDGSFGLLKCKDDGRTYPLHSCHYSPGGSLTFLHSNADGEPSYVMAFFSLTMCNTALGNFEPLHPSTTEEWMYFNSNKPLGFWVKNPCSDVSSRLSIAGGGSIKMTDGKIIYNGATSFYFSFTDENDHNWEGTYNGPIS